MKNNCLVDIEILVFAMRYAIGRQTFAPTIVIENIKFNIDKFKKWQIDSMIDEIKSQHNYGMDCDEQTWNDFLKYLQNLELEQNNDKA